MAEHDRPDPLEHRDVGEQVGADGRVGLDLQPLALIQAAGLAQHALGHADRADVVEQGAQLDRGALVLRETKTLGHRHGLGHRPGGLRGAGVLLGLKGTDERADDRKV